MKKLLYIFAFLIILSIIPLNTVYLFNEKISFFRIFGISYLFLVLVSGVFFSGKIRKSSIRLLKFALILIIFKFLIDITFHYEDPVESVNLLLKELLTVFMLISFECVCFSKKTIESYIITLSWIPVLFGLVQLYNKNFILSNLLNIPGMGVYGDADLYIHNANRIVGTENIAIGFALLLGIIFIIFFFNFLKEKKKLYILPILFIYITLIIFTQTRSAIYGLIPSIFLSYAIVSRMKFVNILFCLLFLVIFVTTFSQMKNFLAKYSERSTAIVDVNTYQKVSSNFWGCYGALMQNPLIGVKKKDLELAVREGQKQFGQILEADREIELSKFSVTNHNLYADYIQHYGVIGFTLLCIVIVVIFRKIFNKINIYDRYKLTAIFIYFFQYVMLHNNQLLLYPLLWILLSLGEEKDDPNIGSNVCLQ